MRSVLWRLRARLVTPPDVDRARYDLDRILDAAKEHAHEPPGGELVEFRDRVTPAVASAGAADDLDADEVVGDDAPTLLRSLKLAPAVAANEANRGVRISHHVSRVAAVAVLVVGVGGGLAAAVDRDGTFLALFASGLSTSAAPSDDPLAVTPSDPLELDAGDLDAGDFDAGDDAEAPEPDDGVDVDSSPPSNEGDGSDREVAQDRDDDATDTSDGSTGSDGGAAESRDEPSSDRSSGNRTERSTDPAPTPSADEPDDEPEGDNVGDTVIALPEAPVDPGDLDGFGGPGDCPEGDLRACLPGTDDGSARDTDDAADGDAGSVDDDAGEDDEGSEEREDKDPLEELAERRFGG